MPGETKVIGTFHSDKKKGQVGMRKEVMTVQTVTTFHFRRASRILVNNNNDDEILSACFHYIYGSKGTFTGS